MFNVSPFPSLAEVNRVLSAWGCQATSYDTARGGVENSSLVVDTPAYRPSRVVLRIHQPDSGARVRLELAALEHLSACGLPVPRPLRTTDGDSLAEYQGSPASLLAYVDGISLDRCVPPRVFGRDIGLLLARVDHALDRLPAGKNAIAHDITDLALARDRLADCRKIDGFPWQRVENAIDDAGRAAVVWPMLPRQVIHGDVSRGNVLYRAGEQFALIDFGDAGAAPRVADVAIALAQLAIVGGRLRPEIWSGLWAGWAAVADPNEAERAAVLPLVRLRYAKLIVDHVWRELAGRHHPGHLALVALGIEGLHALASAPPPMLSLDTGRSQAA